jgi:hypothetical protein
MRCREINAVRLQIGTTQSLFAEFTNMNIGKNIDIDVDIDIGVDIYRYIGIDINNMSNSQAAGVPRC